MKQDGHNGNCRSPRGYMGIQVRFSLLRVYSEFLRGWLKQDTFYHLFVTLSHTVGFAMFTVSASPAAGSFPPKHQRSIQHL